MDSEQWLNVIRSMILTASVADPYHIDSDPDPTFHSDADTDSNPDPTFQCDTTHFYQDLDPPRFQNDPLRLPPFHRILLDPDPAFLRIRIQLPKMMRIHNTAHGLWTVPVLSILSMPDAIKTIVDFLFLHSKCCVVIRVMRYRYREVLSHLRGWAGWWNTGGCPAGSGRRIDGEACPDPCTSPADPATKINPCLCYSIWRPLQIRLLEST